LITTWQHDRVDQSNGSGVMKNNMRIAYETVLYDREITSSENIQSFGDIQHYDTVPSPYSSVSTSGIAKNPDDNTFWEEIFKDLLSNVVDLTGFNSQQRQSQLPLSVQPITQTTNPPANTTNFFPSVINQNITTNAQQVNTKVENLSLSDQEFKRILQSNPKRLADFASNKATTLISVKSGLNVQESKDFYDNLSPNIKTQIEQSALNNFSEINDTIAIVVGTNFESDLEQLGVIG
jgi:hypothetical protein